MTEYAVVLEVWFEADGEEDAREVTARLLHGIRMDPDVRLVEDSEPEDVS